MEENGPPNNDIHRYLAYRVESILICTQIVLFQLTEHPLVPAWNFYSIFYQPQVSEAELTD